VQRVRKATMWVFSVLYRRLPFSLYAGSVAGDGGDGLRGCLGDASKPLVTTLVCLDPGGGYGPPWLDWRLRTSCMNDPSAKDDR
jgi:hypothetical protein